MRGLNLGAGEPTLTGLHTAHALALAILPRATAVGLGPRGVDVGLIDLAP